MSGLVLGTGNKVKSVNGQTGNVVLDADDVGAVPYTGATDDVDLGTFDFTAHTITASPTGNNKAIIANGSGSGVGVDITHAGSGTKLKIGTTGSGDLIDAGDFNVDNDGNVLAASVTTQAQLSDSEVLFRGKNNAGDTNFSVTGEGKININKQAETGVRERLMTATVSDDANASFFINNGTITNGVFAPVFGGYTESASLWPLGFGGYVASSNDASDSSSFGLLDFAVFRTTNAADALNGTLSDVQNRKVMTVRSLTNTFLTIMPDGDVGIGTTSPAQKLDVNGNIRLVGYINPVASGSNSFFGQGTLITGGAAADTAVRANNGNLVFSDNGNQEKMRLTSGNLGIGTGSTVSAKLHAVSTTEQLRLGYDASNYWNATTSATGLTTFDSVGSSAGFGFSDAVSIGTSPAYTQTRLLKVYDNGDTGGARVSIIGTTGISNTPAIEFVLDGNLAKRSLLRMTDEGSNNYGLDFATTASGSVGIRAQMNGNGNWLFGNAGTASARLHGISTTEQLRLGYDASNYFSTTVNSTGGVTFDSVGSGSGFTFSDDISASNLSGTNTGDQDLSGLVTGATDATLTKTGSTLGINLVNSNIWTGYNQFNRTVTPTTNLGIVTTFGGRHALINNGAAAGSGLFFYEVNQGVYNTVTRTGTVTGIGSFQNVMQNTGLYSVAISQFTYNPTSTKTLSLTTTGSECFANDSSAVASGLGTLLKTTVALKGSVQTRDSSDISCVSASASMFGVCTAAKLINVSSNTNNSATLTNVYGAFVSILKSGTGVNTNVYGIYISALQGTNVYGIYDNTGSDWFTAGFIQGKFKGSSGTAGFNGTGAYTNFTIEDGIIIAAS